MKVATVTPHFPGTLDDMADYIRTSSGLTHWKEYGGSGGLIVLVHGLGGSIPTWDAIGPRLTQAGRVVALDLPGYGLSPPAVDWELETHAASITAFIEELGETATLMGNSMGGLLSEMVAAGHPDRVDALVLLSPATPPQLPDPHIHWPTARRLLIQATPILGPAVIKRVISDMKPEEIVNMSLDLVTHNRGRVPLDIVEALVELARARLSLPWAADAIPKTGNSMARHFLRRSDFVATIRKIKAPTLVVHGMDDRHVSPTSVEWLCGLRPDWELVQMEDTGHTPQLDAPVRLLSIVQPWLTQHLSREHTA